MNGSLLYGVFLLLLCVGNSHSSCSRNCKCYYLNARHQLQCTEFITEEEVDQLSERSRSKVLRSEIIRVDSDSLFEYDERKFYENRFISLIEVNARESVRVIFLQFFAFFLGTYRARTRLLSSAIWHKILARCEYYVQRQL